MAWVYFGIAVTQAAIVVAWVCYLWRVGHR